MANHAFVITCIILVGFVAVYSERQEETRINRESFRNYALDRQDFQEKLKRRVRRDDTKADGQIPGCSSNGTDESRRQREEARRIAGERLERVLEVIKRRKEAAGQKNRTMIGGEPGEPDIAAAVAKSEETEVRQNVQDAAEARRKAHNESNKRYREHQKIARQQDPELARIYRERKQREYKRYRENAKRLNAIDDVLMDTKNDQDAAEAQCIAGEPTKSVQKAIRRREETAGEKRRTMIGDEPGEPDIAAAVAKSEETEVRQNVQDAAEARRKARNERIKRRRQRLKIARQQDPELDRIYRERRQREYKRYRENAKRLNAIDDVLMDPKNDQDAAEARRKAHNECNKRYKQRQKIARQQDPELARIYRERKQREYKRYRENAKRLNAIDDVLMDPKNDQDAAEARRKAHNECNKRYKQRQKIARQQDPELDRIYRERKQREYKRYRENVKRLNAIDDVLMDPKNDQDAAEARRKAHNECNKRYKQRQKIARQQDPELARIYREREQWRYERRKENLEAKKVQDSEWYECYKARRNASQMQRRAMLKAAQLEKERAKNP